MKASASDNAADGRTVVDDILCLRRGRENDDIDRYEMVVNQKSRAPTRCLRRRNVVATFIGEANYAIATVCIAKVAFISSIVPNI
tara:strand:+ start:541 stop:795 length:255 start_codon:yes stop_codon:yes gene_type:complete